VLLDVLDDVFLLNLALEAAKCAFDRLAFLNLDFGHACNTPSPARWLSCEHFRKVANMLGYHRQARILGARRRPVNEISRADGSFSSALSPRLFPQRLYLQITLRITAPARPRGMAGPIR
jgi:hypothetical protein